MHPCHVDIWQYYAEVESLIRDLRAANLDRVGDQVESALRGGATSGEVLGQLSVTLPTVVEGAPAFAERSRILANWAREALS